MNKNKNILVVGAGGIGCELAKLLLLSSHCKITLIDFDTIELTNLNRQFLFTNKDIGNPKSKIVCEKLRLLSNLDVEYIFDSIYKYDLVFFSKFDVIYNCLDNNEARSYVNLRCFLLKKLLIDGGSGGHKGQSCVFDYTQECFDCIPKVLGESYNVCTIRSVPTKFEHCIEYVKSTLVDEGLDYEKYVNLRSHKLYKKFIKKMVEVKCEKNKNFAKNRKEIKKVRKYLKRMRKNKEDAKTLNKLIFNLSCIRAKSANIPCKDFIKFETILRNIIPSICTTNSIVASLMLLSEKSHRNYFITMANKKFIEMEPADKNGDCICCSKKWILVKYKKGGMLIEFYKFIENIFTVVCKYLILDSIKIYTTFKSDLMTVFSVQSNITATLGFNIDENMKVYFIGSDTEYSIVKSSDL